MSEKNDVSMGIAGMISVSEKTKTKTNKEKVCNNMNSNIDVSTVFSCKVQSVIKER